MAEGQMNLGTLYEINKNAMAQFEPLTIIDYYNSIKNIVLSLDNNSYMMLLCRERNDYTIFKRDCSNSYKFSVNEIQETINNRGHIIAIDAVENTNNTYEIWIRDVDTEENFLYMFFPCDDFIVEI